MGQFLILLVVAPLVLAALVFGVITLITTADDGLQPAEPDGRAVPLPVTRPLSEADLRDVRFDVSLRGYRMVQVDQAVRRAAYDVGYKEELINVLEAEVTALREGRTDDADALRRARESAARPGQPPASGQLPVPAGPPVDTGQTLPLAGTGQASDGKSPEPAGGSDPEPAADGGADPVQEWVASGAMKPGPDTES